MAGSSGRTPWPMADAVPGGTIWCQIPTVRRFKDESSPVCPGEHAVDAMQHFRFTIEKAIASY